MAVVKLHVIALSVACIFAPGMAQSSMEQDSEGNVIIAVAWPSNSLYVSVNGVKTKVFTESQVEDLKNEMYMEMDAKIEWFQKSTLGTVLMSTKLQGDFQDMTLKDILDEKDQIIDDLVANLTALNEDKADKLDVHEVRLQAGEIGDDLTSLTDAVDDIFEELATIADNDNSTDTCLSALVQRFVSKDGGGPVAECPDPDADSDDHLCPVLKAPTYGEMKGFGRTHGSLTSFTCHDGFTLVGSKDALCKDGEWSHEVPVCAGTVTCDIIVDNFLGVVFVDGKEISWDTSNNQWDSVRQIKFLTTAKTLAFRGLDAEKGCAAGGMAMHCNAVGESPWHDVNSNTNDWKVFGSFNNDGITGTEWTATDFDDSKWHGPAVSMAAPDAKDMCIRADSQPCEWVPGSNENFCPCDNLDEGDRVRAICADEAKAGNSAGGQRTFWWFRISI
jgi:hypothetical protein